MKRLHEILPTFWESIFNKCLLLGCFPAEWKQAKIVVIPKSNKTKAHSVAGYRGISLLAIPGKCLEKLLVGRLNYFPNLNAQIHPQKYGFTEGRSTVDAIKVVVEFVHHNKQLGLKSCLVTLDIACAFDNAWHPGILAKLIKINCPPNIFNLVRDFLNQRKAYLKLGNTTTNKTVNKGCPQGSVSGPILWNIIISDLINQLTNIPNLQIVIFADDIMLMIRGKQHSDVLRTLERALEQANDWSTQNKLSISKEKSAVMPMFIKKRDEYESHPTIIAWELKVVSKMKYLGVMLDSKLDWFPHSIYLENKLLGIRNNLVRCSKATWGISFHKLMSIYNHIRCRSLVYHDIC